MAMIRFPLTQPSQSTDRSLPQLLVARRASQAELQNSVNLGTKAVSMAEGIHISKKLVSIRGSAAPAIFTSVHTVKITSLLQLSHSSRSSSIITFPDMEIF